MLGVASLVTLLVLACIVMVVLLYSLLKLEDNYHKLSRKYAVLANEYWALRSKERIREKIK